MIFNSVTFILFFITIIIFYWSLPSRPRYWMLFLGSLLFYAFWDWEYLGVLLLAAIVDYFVAIKLQKISFDKSSLRKAWLAVSLTVNLGLLFYFKYLMFFSANLNLLFNSLGFSERFAIFNIILPFGISFYTFETISYTVDVYRGHLKAEKKFINYGLFVAFFPKLVAGPIQRAAELIEQLKSRPTFNWLYLSEGIRRILQGLFIKVVIADNIAPIVDEGFAMDPNSLGGIDVITLAFLFGFQIYFDFSGYSHIALGSAKVLGINIPENFNYPYISSSLKEFWKRWHISLSSWIRDYLYLPLTGTKVMMSTGAGGIGQSLDAVPSKRRRNMALFTTWAIMGFWHGASWSFIFWGIYHAFFIFLERKLMPVRKRFSVFDRNFIKWPITTLVVMLSWIPFRASSLSAAFAMFGKIFNFHSIVIMNMRENVYIVSMLMLLIFILAWAVNEWIKPVLIKNNFIWFLLQLIIYSVMIFFVIVFLRPINQFIYFQF